MSVPAGFDPRDAVAVNPSVTNHRPLRASVSQNNPVNCCFLDKPALSWTNSVAALQDHLFDRAKWLNATAMPKRKNHSRAEIARKLAQANRLVANRNCAQAGCECHDLAQVVQGAA
jgi:hypothetical protein